MGEMENGKVIHGKGAFSTVMGTSCGYEFFERRDTQCEED